VPEVQKLLWRITWCSLLIRRSLWCKAKSQLVWSLWNRYEWQVLELEIVRTLRNRCFEQQRPVSLALDAFPKTLQPQLNKYMSKKWNTDLCFKPSSFCPWQSKFFFHICLVAPETTIRFTIWCPWGSSHFLFIFALVGLSLTWGWTVSVADWVMMNWGLLLDFGLMVGGKNICLFCNTVVQVGCDWWPVVLRLR
jgi:hypothetical protein